jgi:hypothetical protein
MRDIYLGDAFLRYASLGAKDGIYMARDSERSIHIQWEPFRIDLVPGVSAGAQGPLPISDALIEPASRLDLPADTDDSTP